ncbi:hypothetical protein BDV36DRAFT_294690 [Aspergillus pseudocaelatus]|uniref:F-box domain-containing protein n=1 Tax=Aspergillus pseudocaelatus TaxID=1825620 RepID=A0ABQ6WTW8_9EURO|nr:hypothetical protein BDV36DRAFT_294690 [Aspergillus pseudocaelatus]
MVVLPDDIWHHIFAEFEDHMPLKNWRMYGAQPQLNHQGPAVLRELCLVCRQFRRIAQPLLYRTILIEGRNEEKDIQTLMLRTLVENPQFGEHVRCVSIDDAVDHWWARQTLADDVVRKLILSALRYLDLPPALTGRLRDTLTDCGLAALEVAYMPHVQFVDCTIPDMKSPLPWMLSGILGLKEQFAFPSYEDSGSWVFHDDEGYHQRQEEQISQSIPKNTFANYGFPNLTEVRIRTGDSKEGRTPAWVIEPLLLHQTLRILRTLGTDWFGQELRDLKWPTQINYNLEYLDLTEAIIDAEGLKTVLTRCQGLRGLSIELPDSRRERDGDFDDWIIDYYKFGNILRQHGRNLEEFDLHTAEYEEDHSPGEGRLGSLRELTSLRHLKVSKDALLGKQVEGEPSPLSFSEALPDSVETLHLHWSEHYFIESWFNFTRQVFNKDVHKLLVEDKTPNLREVRMERGYNESKENEWPAELKVGGWDVEIVDERTWQKYHSSGCVRTIVTLSKNI